VLLEPGPARTVHDAQSELAELSVMATEVRQRAPDGSVAEGDIVPYEPYATALRATGFAPALCLGGKDEVAVIVTLAGAWAGVRSKYLFSAHAGPLDKLADIVFPVAVPAEKSGTYINIEGTRQTFAPAVTPAAGVPPESAILARLADSLALDAGGGDVR
jgi:hypothetical protein